MEWRQEKDMPVFMYIFLNELWNKIVYFMTDYINGETVWG